MVPVVLDEGVVSVGVVGGSGSRLLLDGVGVGRLGLPITSPRGLNSGVPDERERA